jgi:hypothetical protein
MHPDRLADLVHRGEEGLEFRPVEGLALNVGIDLHAERAEFLGRALGLFHARIARCQRDLRDKSGEPIRMLGNEFGEAVIDHADIVIDRFAFGHRLHGRHWVGDDLGVVGERIHDPEADIEIVN